MKYTPLAKNLLRDRYLRNGETPEDMFKRVAGFISDVETNDRARWNKEFFEVMNNLDFLPNSPCLMNAGTGMPQLAACFVYPIEDDMESIFETLKKAAITHQSGGGTGFSFSNIRPQGYPVRKSGGIATGPVSFMEVYDKATHAVRQGGKRRGANMGILRVDHPDVDTFITAKKQEHKLNNFNISVAVTDEFMDSLNRDEDYNLYFPVHGKKRGEKRAKYVFERIAKGAWENGEPGVIFIDKINNSNPLKKLGDIQATNPCGEMPLLPHEACVLGSVNLANHVKNNDIDWGKLEHTVKVGVRFLDNSIDVSDFPFPEIEKMVSGNRKIGLGVMGFASMLLKLEIPYNTARAVWLARRIMKFIRDKSHEASRNLAAEKGVFPNFYESSLSRDRRNALTTTIAPTGSISIIAGTSSGIEPLYSMVAERRMDDGQIFDMIEPSFKQKLEQLELNERDIVEKIKEKGGFQDLDEIPEIIKKVFVTAMDIDPRIHVLMQAAFQRFVDNAISKTVNLPEKFTVKGVENIIKKAYRTGCKGITVYRQHSRQQQVLNITCDCEGGGDEGSGIDN
ncbi:MAG: adenosylcobalamin-dependent ribonucleoside-diphosphate reductase [Elusimicrobiota bacterium]